MVLRKHGLWQVITRSSGLDRPCVEKILGSPAWLCPRRGHSSSVLTGLVQSAGGEKKRKMVCFSSVGPGDSTASEPSGDLDGNNINAIRKLKDLGWGVLGTTTALAEDRSLSPSRYDCL